VEEAIAFYTQALEIAREIGDRRGEGTHLSNLGLAYYSLGQVEEAIKYHTQALEIAREIGDRRMEGSVLGSLGMARDLGQVEEIIASYTQALEIARQIGDRRREGFWLTTIAWVESAYNENDDLAMSMLDESVSICTKIGNASGLTIALLVRGMVEWVLRKDKLARETWKQALAIALGSGYKPIEVLLRALIAFVDGEEGYREEAKEALHVSRQEWEKMGLSPQFLDLVQVMLRSIETGNFPE
jgi:tetratricopeptide (TPR) repeat protein